jgi:Glycosyl transferase family 11
MVTVFLRGGLGNQMFQYAAGLALAKKQGTSLLLDTTFLNDRFPRKQFTYRTYDLDVFDIKPKFTLLSEVSAQMPIPGLWLGLDLVAIKGADIFGTQKLLKEKKDYVFQEAVFNENTSALLWGFWNTEKYFDDAQNEVRDAFRFRPSENAAIIAAKKEIVNSNAVALHVRRGDYLLPKHAKVYGTTDVSYYDRAIAYMAERVKSPTFFVFSDDIEWCRENIKTSFPAVFMTDETRGPKASGHLELMSLCKHNIIANSTFSWWGAWLNANPEKIVVAPKAWDQGSLDQKKDVIPQGWVTI